MAINFPDSPVNGDTHVVGNVTYVYDNAKAKWNGAGQTPNDRLTEGSNSLEITSGNDLVWTGDNVGIGVTGPSARLDISNSGTTGKFFQAIANLGTNNNRTYNLKPPSTDSASEPFTWQTANSHAWQVDAIEALRIDSGGRLITGNYSTALDTTVGSIIVNGETSGGRIATRGSGSSANTTLGEMFGFWDTNKVAGFQFAGGSDTTNKDDGQIKFYTSASGPSVNERLRITSDGDVQVKTGNLVIGTSGKGIDFSATANSSGTMSSEILDDYEEGTFTPNLDVTGSSGSLSIGYSNQVGRYVKVGRIVHFTIDIRLSSWSRGSGTGGILVQGLPFPPVNSSNYSRATGFCNLYNWDYSADSADIPIYSVYQLSGQPWVNINKHREGDTNSDVSDPGNSSMMFFSGTYEAGA